MSLFTRDAKAIKIEKVSNGFVLRVYKAYDECTYDYSGSWKTDKVFTSVTELVDAIQDVWTPEAVVTQ